MSLTDLKGKLSKNEMKQIKGGSNDASGCAANCMGSCMIGKLAGTCHSSPSTGKCYCVSVY